MTKQRRVTYEQVRQIALALPGVEEGRQLAPSRLVATHGAAAGVTR